VGGWVSRLATWKQVLLFVGVAGSLGWSLWTGLSGLERQTGLMAGNFGWARTDDVTASIQDLKAWQLYSDIRRIKRAIYDMGQPTEVRERERFEDLQTQLTTIQTEYDRITKLPRSRR
jgi:hypothetical protein